MLNHDPPQLFLIDGHALIYRAFYALISRPLRTSRGENTSAAWWVDQGNATERLGVPPHQVVDYLALVGDTSDNIPGVRGIGEKTAVQLLQEFGDLETLLARAEEVKLKRPREALLAEVDNARLSK